MASKLKIVVSTLTLLLSKTVSSCTFSASCSIVAFSATFAVSLRGVGAQSPTPAPTVFPTCGGGHFVDSLGDCQSCEVGRFSNNTASSLACELCAAGKYAPSAGAEKCIECLGGKISSQDRASCDDCEAGQFAEGGLNCTKCPNGTYAPQALTGECFTCGAGSYTNLKATGCSPCDAGRYSSNLTVLHCTACPVGTSSASGQEKCVDCEKGTFADTEGNPSCSKCASGKYANSTASSKCTDCPLGKEQSNSGAAQCDLCEAGFYADVNGSSSCSRCAAGYAIATSGQPTCEACAPGQYQSSTGSDECQPCTEGKFADSNGSLACTDCALGRSSSGGSGECALAAPGYYLTSGGDYLECPRGSSCLGGNEMPRPNAEFWVDRSDLNFAGNIYKCPRRTCKGVEDPEVDSTCWTGPTPGECDSDALQCADGAGGPLCGYCKNYYVYSAAEQTCVKCDASLPLVLAVFGIGLCGMVLGFFFYTGRLNLPTRAERWWLVGMFRQIDSGTFRVLWSSYQIIQSCSWNLDVEFPPLFSSLINLLSVFSFDFLALECLQKNSNHFTSVALWSVIPAIMGLTIVLVYFARKYYYKKEHLDDSLLYQQHAWYFLMLTYLVLPPVSRKQLQALDCEAINESSYLRTDTSIDCESAEFKSFAALDFFFLAIYLSIPLVWSALLWRVRNRLNPPSKNYKDAKAAMAKRSQDIELKPLAFLFSVYKADCYWFEPLEMYRRIVFVGVVPLLSARISRRAAIGVALALISAVAYREIEPFGRSSTNVLVHVAQYSILLTFASALAIETDLTKNLNSFAFGLLLVFVNLVILFIALALGAYRHYLDQQLLWKWQRLLTSQELRVVDIVMGGKDEGAAASPLTGGVGGDPKGSASSGKLLQQHLLRSKDVVLKRRVGKGAFGEVFLGTCFGEDVAVKTVLEVTQANMGNFRAEILLTATLRHPCIVNFKGACWGQDLTCLVLEWVPRGTLSDLLKDQDRGLRWDAPLLPLVTDVARGLQYLHGRDFFDESDGRQKRCIVHRDLKPDNVLITEYTRAKVADFGSSKALSNVLETKAAGTPLFAAPEVLLGEMYSEKVDVYSFGMLLADAAAAGGLINFLVERWREANQDIFKGGLSEEEALFNAIKDIMGKKWRPVTEHDYGIPSAPPLISALISQCTEPDPTLRPTFNDIIDELMGPCSAQVDSLTFVRGGPTVAGKFDPEGAPDAGQVGGSPLPDREQQKSEALLRTSLVYRAGASNPLVAGRKSTVTEQVEMSDLTEF